MLRSSVARVDYFSRLPGRSRFINMSRWIIREGTNINFFDSERGKPTLRVMWLAPVPKLEINSLANPSIRTVFDYILKY